MELRDYVRILRRRWKSIASLVVLGAVAGLAFALLSPKVYGAESKVYVKVPSSNAGTAYQALQYVLGQMPSYAQLDGSPEVLHPVIVRLGLDDSVQSFATQVTISNPTGTVYLDVDATASSKSRARSIAAATSAQLASVIDGLSTSADTASRVVVASAQPATSSNSPVSPKPTLDIALGLVTGLVLGMILAIVRNRLDTSIRSVDDLHQLTGVPPLARVPAHPDAVHGAIPTPAELSAEQLRAFRALRTDLALASGGHLPPSIVVVASDTDDGPDVAVNLAHVAARSGISTCLVEADLRRPQLAAALSRKKTAGLTAVLEGTAVLSDAVFAWPRVGPPTPAIVVAGRGADDPADLLDSPAMQRVHRVLRASFDLVIFIGPSARDGSDAVILARDVAAAVLVVRAGTSSHTAFAAAADAMDAVDATVAGVVLVEATKGGRGPRSKLTRSTTRARRDGMTTPLTSAALTPVPLREGSSFDPPARDRFAPSADRPFVHRPSRPASEGPGVLPPRARSSYARRTAPGPVQVVEPVESVEPVEPSES